MLILNQLRNHNGIREFHVNGGIKVAERYRRDYLEPYLPDYTRHTDRPLVEILSQAVSDRYAYIRYLREAGDIEIGLIDARLLYNEDSFLAEVRDKAIG